MTIQSIKEQKKKKNRFNLFSDNEFIGALNLESIVKYNITENMEMDSARFSAILAEDNEHYAFETALNYISYQGRTEWEIRRYLGDRDIGEDTADLAVKKLKGYGYIDDLGYASEYAKSLMHTKNLGKRALEFKLKEKGIDRYTIEDVLAELPREDELENAKALYGMLIKKYAKDDEKKKRAKILRAMAAKGFDYETVQSIVSVGED